MKSCLTLCALLLLAGRAGADGARLSDLVTRSSLPKPTVRRVLLALVRAGLLGVVCGAIEQLFGQRLDTQEELIQPGVGTELESLIPGRKWVDRTCRPLWRAAIDRHQRGFDPAIGADSKQGGFTQRKGIPAKIAGQPANLKRSAFLILNVEQRHA